MRLPERGSRSTSREGLDRKVDIVVFVAGESSVAVGRAALGRDEVVDLAVGFIPQLVGNALDFGRRAAKGARAMLSVPTCGMTLDTKRGTDLRSAWMNS